MANTNYKQLIDDLATIATDLKDSYISGLREDGEPLTFNEKQKLLSQYLAIVDRVKDYEKQTKGSDSKEHKQLSLIPFTAFYPEQD